MKVCTSFLLPSGCTQPCSLQHSLLLPTLFPSSRRSVQLPRAPRSWERPQDRGALFSERRRLLPVRTRLRPPGTEDCLFSDKKDDNKHLGKRETPKLCLFLSLRDTLTFRACRALCGAGITPLHFASVGLFFFLIWLIFITPF